jgi:hypothetical protein
MPQSIPFFSGRLCIDLYRLLVRFLAFADIIAQKHENLLLNGVSGFRPPSYPSARSIFLLFDRVTSSANDMVSVMMLQWISEAISPSSKSIEHI